MSEDDERPTEDRLESAIQLYEMDSKNWDCEILLDELERLYRLRETVNRLIRQFKATILEELK